MAYRLQRREPVPDAFRRIADEQFLGLTTALGDETGAGIHEARKRCKMLRALVQLVARPPATLAFSKADAALQRILHALAPLRDAEARLHTLETLLTRGGPRVPARFASVRAMLQAQAASARRLTLTAADLRDIVAMAGAAQVRLEALPIAHKGWRALAPGLRGAYRRGRKALEAARNDPSPELRHRWRRQVKQLWHHVRLLQSAQPKKFAALARKLDALATGLGDEHDLALLREHLAIHGKRSRTRAEFDGLATLIDRRRTDLRRSADKLGRALYKAKPADFVARIERAWRRWRE